MTNAEEKIHNVPVPERFLPLITRTLAEAYAAEGLGGGYLGPSSLDPTEGAIDVEVWNEEEIARAYRESTPSQRKILDLLTDHPGQPVSSLELGRTVYPGFGSSEAEGKVFGSLGGIGTRFSKRYNKAKWFFVAEREVDSDGNTGHILYTMPEEAAQVIMETRR